MIKPQEVQMLGHEVLLEMKRSGQDMSALVRDSFSGMCGNDPVVCAGFIEMWEGRGTVWAVIDSRVSPNIFLSIHRQVAQAIDAYQPKIFKRLEMTAVDGFKEARRWAKMLGFHKEGHLQKYDPLGRNYTLYARIR